MFYRRRVGGNKEWTDEEKKIIREHYLSMPRTELVALLPDKTWDSIMQMAGHIFRNEGERDEHRKRETFPRWMVNCSHSDLVFMREHNIEGKLLYTNWVSLSALPWET